MLQITMTQKNLVKNPNTKTSYIKESEEVTQISEREFKNITSEDTCKWLRRVGGVESVTRNYTNYGYVVTKLISTSPNKQIKKIRTFDFEYID